MGFPRTAALLTSVSSITVLALFCRPWGSARAAETPPASPIPSSQEVFQKTVTPLLVQNCYECHANGKHKGDLALDSFKTIQDVEKHRDQWEEVLKNLRNGDMPPADAKRKPSASERTTMTDWIQRELYQYDPAHPYPGRVTLHRLNRAEYNNTVRDLLAIDLNLADAFPVDDAGYGFDNNGDVLTLAPILMEKYLDAAGRVLDKAIYADPVVPAPSKQISAADMEGSIPKSDPTAAEASGFNATRRMPLGRVFNYSGEIVGDFDFPVDGEYVLRMRAYGKQRPMVQFKLDGENVGRPVAIAEDIQNTSVYGPDKLKVPAGKHRLTLVFLNGATKEDYEKALAAAAAKAATQPATAPAAPAADNTDANNEDNVTAAPAARARPQAPVVDDTAEDPAAAPPARARPQAPAVADAAGAGPAPGPTTAAATNPARGPGGARGAAGARGARGAAGARGARGGAAGRGPAQSLTGKPTMGVIWAEVEGPEDITPDRMPESYRRVMVAYPSATVSKPQAAEKIIRNFATKAYRRPVDDAEVSHLMDLWSKQDAAGYAFDASIHTTLEAVLVSPYFLYRYEKDPEAKEAGGVRTLDEFELASRLSYFLWSTMPDEELFNLAKAGQLRANLAAQVRRMMNDPKSFALVENFAGQWLQLRKMSNVGPDPARFPTFDDSLRQAMIKETQLYFSSIMTEDRSVLDFLDSDYTFLNEQLAKHYGRTDIKGDNFRRVALTGNQRGGLVTQASILTITSYFNRTSPVQRGKWVLENLLDAAPPPPPPDVPKLVETAQAELTGTLRQRMEQHRTDPKCFSCHAQMDPIGFGLENYDAIGAWREQDINNVAIDASGTLPDGTTFQGAAGLKEILKARKDQFCRCLTDRMVTYALGRGTEGYDRPMEDQIAAGLKKDNYKFSSLIMQIVDSDAFQKRGSKRGEQ